MNRYTTHKKTRWPYNLSLNRVVTKEMSSWLTNLGHGDICFKDNSPINIKTKEFINVEAVYFLWGVGNTIIQFKYETDMIHFVLKFA